MSESLEQMRQRKQDHIEICMNDAVETSCSGFDKVELLSTALPEMAFDDVCTQQDFLNARFSMPLLIAGMTGGVEKAAHINAALAKAAERKQIPMGLGSQKMMARDAGFVKYFDVRKFAPKVFLIGNFGAADLNSSVSIDNVKCAVDEVGLNAVALHLNALQECVQPEGNRDFSGVLKNIEKVVHAVSVPVMVKEVGAGVSGDDYRRLAEVGVACVDVGGRGGTSWSRIEGMRGSVDDKRVGELFANWGVSTADAICACRKAHFSCDVAPQIVATGGIRDGLAVAKAVALGAQMCGVALPFLRAALLSENIEVASQNVVKEIEFFERTLRIAMFCSGSRNLYALQKRVRMISNSCSC